jgi:hypothetical protein
MSITFGMESNRDVDVYLTELESSLSITAGDALFALTNQQQRMDHRTQVEFVDYEGVPFAPYDESKPYYYYPFGGKGLPKGATAKNFKVKKGHQHALAFIPPGGTKSRGRGIRYDSYGAFKRALGAAGVNLTGPSSPHMLDNMEVRVNGVPFSINSSTDFDLLTAPAFSATIGIYGDFGQRAAWHNEGMGRNPHREFFAISASDRDDIIQDVIGRLKRRLELS